MVKNYFTHTRVQIRYSTGIKVASIIVSSPTQTPALLLLSPKRGNNSRGRGTVDVHVAVVNIPWLMRQMPMEGQAARFGLPCVPRCSPVHVRPDVRWHLACRARVQKAEQSSVSWNLFGNEILPPWVRREGKALEVLLVPQHFFFCPLPLSTLVLFILHVC